jgi:hypothetical protein
MHEPVPGLVAGMIPIGFVTAGKSFRCVYLPRADRSICTDPFAASVTAACYSLFGFRIRDLEEWALSF